MVNNYRLSAYICGDDGNKGSKSLFIFACYKKEKPLVSSIWGRGFIFIFEIF